MLLLDIVIGGCILFALICSYRKGKANGYNKALKELNLNKQSRGSNKDE